MGKIDLMGPGSANAGATLRYNAIVSDGPKGKSVTLRLQGASASPASKDLTLDSDGGGSASFQVTFDAGSTTVVELICCEKQGKVSPGTQTVTVVSSPAGSRSLGAAKQKGPARAEKKPQQPTPTPARARTRDTAGRPAGRGKVEEQDPHEEER